jgi:hypothetical protein
MFSFYERIIAFARTEKANASAPMFIHVLCPPCVTRHHFRFCEDTFSKFNGKRASFIHVLARSWWRMAAAASTDRVRTQMRTAPTRFFDVLQGTHFHHPLSNSPSL